MKNIFKKIDFPFLSESHRIEKCYIKKQYFSDGTTHISKKAHYHSFFEVHFILEGNMLYTFDDKEVLLEEGDFVVITPRTKHMCKGYSDNICRYCLAFSFVDKEREESLAKAPFLISRFEDDIRENLRVITECITKRNPDMDIKISAGVFDIICSLPIIFKDKYLEEEAKDADFRLEIAIQYINDNIMSALACAEVAKFCFLSTKQLSRIFLKYKGVSLKKYINQKRVKKAEELISESKLSLREISDKMCFCNEYYFNTFFQKNAGMSPGEFRKANN